MGSSRGEGGQYGASLKGYWCMAALEVVGGLAGGWSEGGLHDALRGLQLWCLWWCASVLAQTSAMPLLPESVLVQVRAKISFA